VALLRRSRAWNCSAGNCGCSGGIRQGHDDRTRPAGFSHVWCVSGIRAQLDPRAHPSGSCCCSARRPDGRPSAKTHRRRHRGCQGDASQPRHRRHPNRAPSRCLSGDALSVHPRRANREYPWSLKRRFTIRPVISRIFGARRFADLQRQTRPAITPPSTSWIAPVVQLALSDKRNTMWLARSSGRPTRPTG